MAAYNFQKQFVPAIETGAKTNTIRKIGKRRHARPGEAIQLYTGMRTKSCRKIIEPDPVCLGVKLIRINVGYDAIESVIVGYKLLQESRLERFAKGDGFDSLERMHQFWIEFHGVGKFIGLFISWGFSDGCR